MIVDKSSIIVIHPAIYHLYDGCNWRCCNKFSEGTLYGFSYVNRYVTDETLLMYLLYISMYEAEGVQKPISNSLVYFHLNCISGTLYLHRMENILKNVEIRLYA